MQAPPPDRVKGRCKACGELLSTGPHWLSDRPDGIHTRCVPHGGQPWPYTWLRRKLRADYARLRDEGAGEDVLAIVAELGRWLRERERLWPVGRDETKREVDRRVHVARARAEALGVHVFW